MAQSVKNLPDNAVDTRDSGSTPDSGRPLGEGNGNPLLYSCLKNSMDREAWWATVHEVAKSWTWLSIHACTHTNNVTSIAFFLELLLKLYKA